MPAHPVLASPLTLAFEQWLQHQQLRGRLRLASSQAVYRSIWGALTDWCGQQQPPLRRLARLDAPTMLAYVGSRDTAARNGQALTARYQARLLRLVARVQHHAAELAAAQQRADLAQLPTQPRPNPRPMAASLALGVIRDDAPNPPEHLGPEAALKLQQWLQSTPAEPALRWQDQRDRCACALQLGAGLGPGDLRALRLGDVWWQPLQADALAEQDMSLLLRPGLSPADQALAPTALADLAASTLPWALQVSANGNAPAHLAPLPPWAARLLAQWLTQRQALALPGPVLLPSTRSGKPWGKVAQYNASLAVLQAAGLPSRRAGGSFRLRHSFALQQLALGHAPELVARWLGVADPAVMARYRQAMRPMPLSPVTTVPPESRR